MDVINNGVDEAIFNALVERNAHVPFYNHIGIRTMELSPGHAKMTVETPPEYGNINGDVHGGIIMALGDSSMATAVRTYGDATTTVQLQINFMRPGIMGDTLSSEATIISRGHRMIYAEAVVLCRGKEIASVKGTFFRTGDLIEKK